MHKFEVSNSNLLKPRFDTTHFTDMNLVKNGNTFIRNNFTADQPSGDKYLLAICLNSLLSSSKHCPSIPNTQLATLFNVYLIHNSLASKPSPFKASD